MASEGATLIERYVLESKIASGGMASVWRARDEVLARTVAVKILHPHLAEDETFVERFRVEALAAARLAHPNIVAIYDTGSESSGADIQHFIVMEHCGGGTLDALNPPGGLSDPQQVAGIGSTICDALFYAHTQGVVHRDIKPANVLISEHHNLKVTDFGIAKAAFTKTDITTTGSIIGTVTYISPEQANGDEPDARSDLYSLGVLLYELLAGRPPFREETDVATALKHLHEKPPSPRSIRAGIPRDLEAVIMKSLAKDPGARFQTAQEMKEALGNGHAAGTHTRVIETPAPRTSPSIDRPVTDTGPRAFISEEGRRMLPILVLVIGAIVAAIVIASALTQEDESTDRGSGNGNGGGSAATEIQISAAEDFDPPANRGDGVEHPDDVAAAFDGDEGTGWTTEGYDDPIELQKDGVGLVFDLGESVEVTEVEAVFDTGGYSLELRAADEKGGSAGDFEVIEEISSSDSTQVFDAGGTKARYWLVWITSLPGDGGGRGVISEVRFLGS